MQARLLHCKALERELKGTIRRDAPGRKTAGAVALVSRDGELALLADFHAQAALVPAFDHAADAGLVGKGCLPRVFRRPKLCSRLLDHAERVDCGCTPLGDLHDLKKKRQ